MKRKSPSTASETTPRSFRMTTDLLALLEERAQAVSESTNALAVRLIAEGLRLDDHPLVYFRSGGSGVRRPTLIGSRVDISQVVSTLRDSENDIDATVGYLQLSKAQVLAAVQYYADYGREIDSYIADEQAFSERERQRWERARRILA